MAKHVIPLKKGYFEVTRADMSGALLHVTHFNRSEFTFTRNTSGQTSVLILNIANYVLRVSAFRRLSRHKANIWNPKI
jgi:hypothetical protein